jgi:hypothetical protein
MRYQAALCPAKEAKLYMALAQQASCCGVFCKFNMLGRWLGIKGLDFKGLDFGNHVIGIWGSN